MSEWTLLSWVSPNGKRPIKKWLDTLSQGQYKAIDKELQVLRKLGHELRLPHTKALGNGLFELREKIFGYRIYYGFFPGKIILLLHAGDKSSQKKDIPVARLRLKEFYAEL